jgi:hypothetical protein
MNPLILEFCDLLQGKYNNWQQASSNPRQFSHVMLNWDRLSENEMKIKQWYVHDGEEKPYRERWHRVLTVPESNVIIVENWDEGWKTHNECCDTVFQKVENSYEGTIIGNNCVVKNAVVKSSIRFDGKTYQSLDQGWNENNLVWGSHYFYKFHKIS